LDSVTALGVGGQYGKDGFYEKEIQNLFIKRKDYSL
jgi:hypothetical protein